MTGGDRPDWSTVATPLASAVDLCREIDDPVGLDQSAASWRDGVAETYGLDVTDERTAYTVVVGLALPILALDAHDVPSDHPGARAIVQGAARTLAYLLPALPVDVQELAAARLDEILAEPEADS